MFALAKVFADDIRSVDTMMTLLYKYLHFKSVFQKKLCFSIFFKQRASQNYCPHVACCMIKVNITLLLLYMSIQVSYVLCNMTNSTHCSLVTPYGDTDLGQHWFK